MLKSLKNKRKSNGKSKKNQKSLNLQKNHIVKTFLEMLNTIKIHHWKTRQYSVHKATDHLYDDLDKNIDKFVEVLLGKCQSRLTFKNVSIKLIDYDNINSIKIKVIDYRNFLISLNGVLNINSDSDLMSIRDDILSDLNQFLYLTSLK